MRRISETTKPTVSAVTSAPFVGPITLVCTADGLIEVRWGAHELPQTGDAGAQAHLAAALDQIAEYSAGTRKDFTLPIDYSNMPDHRWEAVLRLCAAIPGGTTRTYGQLAAEMGIPDGARLVGGVMAGNPMPIVIPCHRVVSVDGSLRGYGGPGGIDTKAKLLVFEGARLVA
ncbi:MAG TPA: methylated-DNA--[protein]-cysteine S-methyltransferase [Bellilinea sp.]|nr:methylated-DNA--[protein]-cysteine S-methyltransferase [Bellilinea sp.]